MRACSSSRASCHPLMVADPTLSAFFATILLPSSPHRKGTAQINLSDAVGTVFDTRPFLPQFPRILLTGSSVSEKAQYRKSSFRESCLSETRRTTNSLYAPILTHNYRTGVIWFPRIPYTGSPVSENFSSRRLGE